MNTYMNALILNRKCISNGNDITSGCTMCLSCGKIKKAKTSKQTKYHHGEIFGMVLPYHLQNSLVPKNPFQAQRASQRHCFPHYKINELVWHQTPWLGATRKESILYFPLVGSTLLTSTRKLVTFWLEEMDSFCKLFAADFPAVNGEETKNYQR